MQLFSWVQNKLSSKPNIQTCHKNQTVKSGDLKEEFSDWPNGFLSIGTLFNKAVKDDTKDHTDVEDNDQNLTSDEVKQLQKELNSFISSTDLDCLSTFEAENNNDLEDIDDQHYTIILNNKPKDVCFDNTNNSNAISKKSLSFLLKKMFVCGAGFNPTFSLRDPTMLPPKTRMNKILRALLRKKIHPQSPSPTMTRKNCLESRQAGRSSNFDDSYDNFYLQGSDSSKWVKTDTEYIVLEI
ncbi:hypothetical protein RND81_06G178100 [Saponaria officinalis]|uniref:Uncharacterized protein n=1 Tax=Saponaria officinalis TaxID=3572 RepID=A0AAW1KBQ3_SAPOF